MALPTGTAKEKLMAHRSTNLRSSIDGRVHAVTAVTEVRKDTRGMKYADTRYALVCGATATGNSTDVDTLTCERCEAAVR
jgi:hypothetical protein